MSDLYFNEESVKIQARNKREEKLRKIQVTMKNFTPPFFNHFHFEPEQKKLVVRRAMIKELNTSTLQLLIYYILELES